MAPHPLADKYDVVLLVARRIKKMMGSSESSPADATSEWTPTEANEKVLALAAYTNGRERIVAVVQRNGPFLRNLERISSEMPPPPSCLWTTVVTLVDICIRAYIDMFLNTHVTMNLLCDAQTLAHLNRGLPDPASRRRRSPRDGATTNIKFNTYT